MAKNKSLYDNLKGNRQGKPKQSITLQDVIHARKPLDVNKELMEDNPDIDSILQDTHRVLNNDGERSDTRFVVPPYEKQIKDKRYKSTQVHNTKLDNK